MRPAFGAPSVNAFQMQQLHQGQPAPPTPQIYSNQQSNVPFGNGPDTQHNGRGSPYQQLNYNGGPFGGAQQQAPLSFMQPPQPFIPQPIPDPHLAASAIIPAAVSVTTLTQDAKSEDKKADAPAEKKSKKDKEKDRGTRMIYVDNEISPEEKLASISRYASP